jgi:hypothetical protein
VRPDLPGSRSAAPCRALQFTVRSGTPRARSRAYTHAAHLHDHPVTGDPPMREAGLVRGVKCGAPLDERR